MSDFKLVVFASILVIAVPILLVRCHEKKVNLEIEKCEELNGQLVVFRHRDVCFAKGVILFD